MEKKVYITEEEREKCQKVVDAFAELYDMADIVVVDVGRYGFVMLKYYMPPHGFEEDETYTNSSALFEGLWQEWLNTKLYLMARERQLDDFFYDKYLTVCQKKNSQHLLGRKSVSHKSRG